MDDKWILEQSESTANGRFLSSSIVVISILATCCAIAISIYAWVQSNKVNEATEKLQQSFSKLQADYEELKRDNSKQGFTINQLQNNLLYANIQHDMEENVVSDHLILDKIYFDDIVYRKGTSGTTIDVRTQSKFNTKYAGSGKFTLSDKELNNVVTTFMQAARDQYEWCLEMYSMDAVAPDWNELTHTITINNYDLGTYHNGVFTPVKN